MIYFLQPAEGGPVKIGTSVDVESRRRQLEIIYGQPMALLATMPGSRHKERSIHQRFSHLRLGRTEQFRPALDLMNFIGRPLLVDANPDAVSAVGKRLVPVRLCLSRADHDRFERCARKLGLTKASLARMIVLESLGS